VLLRSRSSDECIVFTPELALCVLSSRSSRSSRPSFPVSAYSYLYPALLGEVPQFAKSVGADALLTTNLAANHCCT